MQYLRTLFSGIKKGTARRLCCDVKISEPLLIGTVKLQWYYYEELGSFGSADYTVIQVRLCFLLISDFKENKKWDCAATNNQTGVDRICGLKLQLILQIYIEWIFRTYPHWNITNEMISYHLHKTAIKHVIVGLYYSRERERAVHFTPRTLQTL